VGIEVVVLVLVLVQQVATAKKQMAAVVVVAAAAAEARATVRSQALKRWVLLLVTLQVQLRATRCLSVHLWVLTPRAVVHGH
jgi:hypothetical protein